MVRVDDDLSRAGPGPLKKTKATRGRRQPGLAPDVREELVAAGGPRRAPGLQRKLAEAARAFDGGRYADAVRLLRPLAEGAPNSAAIRELLGLAQYRLGRWRPATKELEAAHRLTSSFDQHPVMADCQRALGRHRAVETLFEDLRRASPGADIVAEGRIVMAGSLADRGDLQAAIDLLERHGVPRARPQEYHLRMWYALADLYERAGDVPRARELFRQILARDAAFHDVAQRLTAL